MRHIVEFHFYQGCWGKIDSINAFARQMGNLLGTKLSKNLRLVRCTLLNEFLDTLCSVLNI